MKVGTELGNDLGQNRPLRLLGTWNGNAIRSGCLLLACLGHGIVFEHMQVSAHEGQMMNMRSRGVPSSHTGSEGDRFYPLDLSATFGH